MEDIQRGRAALQRTYVPERIDAEPDPPTARTRKFCRRATRHSTRNRADFAHAAHRGHRQAYARAWRLQAAVKRGQRARARGYRRDRENKTRDDLCYEEPEDDFDDSYSFYSSGYCDCYCDYCDYDAEMDWQRTYEYVFDVQDDCRCS